MDTLNIIHLRKELYDFNSKEYNAALLRENNIYTQMQEQGISDFKIWDGVIEEKTSTGINKAHKQIVKWANDNHKKYCIICEDDTMWSCPDSFKYFVSQIPQDFDLFMAMVYSAEIEEDRILNGFSGLTAYVVSNTFFNFFLSAPEQAHLDRWLGIAAFERKYYVCNPYVALQRGGYSSNLRREMFYEAYTDSMKFYGREGQKFYRGEWISSEQAME